MSAPKILHEKLDEIFDRCDGAAGVIGAKADYADCLTHVCFPAGMPAHLAAISEEMLSLAAMHEIDNPMMRRAIDHAIAALGKLHSASEAAHVFH